MPVEIKELIIRAETTAASQSSPDESGNQITPDTWDAIIQEVVRQVLKILQKSKER